MVFSLRSPTFFPCLRSLSTANNALLAVKHRRSPQLRILKGVSLGLNDALSVLQNLVVDTDHEFFMGFPSSVLRIPTSLWVEPVTRRFSPSPKDGMAAHRRPQESRKGSPFFLSRFTNLHRGFHIHSFPQVTDRFLSHEKQGTGTAPPG